MADASSFDSLIDELPDLICRYRPDGTLLYVNRAYADYYGTTADELVGRSFLDLVPPSLRPKVEANLAVLEQLVRERPVHVNEHRSVDGSGEVRWQQWTDKALFDDDGRIVEIISIGRDVTERRQAEERARFLAAHDPLTGLLNRRSLLEGLELALANARRTKVKIGLLYLDVNGFKSVNDRFGHAAGDELLTDIADRLRAGFRSADLVARMGGDEFVVLCTRLVSDTHLDRLAERAEALVAAAGTDGPAARGVAVGTAISEEGDDADSLLQRADRDMYRVKTGLQASPSG